jgi:hypothetical protein
VVFGEEYSATYTSEVEFRPDGTGYIEFRGFSTTKSGEVGRYTGMGNGLLRPDGTQVWRGVACFSNPPGKYAGLNGIAVVWEVEVAQDGTNKKQRLGVEVKGLHVRENGR